MHVFSVMTSLVCVAGSMVSAGSIYSRQLPPEFLEKIPLKGKEYELPKVVGRGATSIVYKIAGKFEGHEAVAKVIPNDRGMTGEDVQHEVANLHQIPHNLYLYHEHMTHNKPPFWVIVLKDARQLPDGVPRQAFLEWYKKEDDVKKHLTKFQKLVEEELESLAKKGLLFKDLMFSQFVVDKALKSLVVMDVGPELKGTNKDGVENVAGSATEGKQVEAYIEKKLPALIKERLSMDMAAMKLGW